MSHVSDQMKGAAHPVTGSNTADGWAEAIEHYVLAD